MQTIEIIDTGNGVTIVAGATLHLPRKGEVVLLRGIQYRVDEVVFDFDEVKRLGIGTKAELSIRVYVSRTDI